jgi:hypothetical protein
MSNIATNNNYLVKYKTYNTWSGGI